MTGRALPRGRGGKKERRRSLALPGVKAVMSGRDLVEFPWDKPAILGIPDLRFNSRNVVAREKALYAGHAVAAVAATSAKIASEALKLIEVDYEVLPWVIDVDEGDVVERGAAAVHLGQPLDGNHRTVPVSEMLPASRPALVVVRRSRMSPVDGSIALSGRAVVPLS